jgi:hypothetical protein
MQNATYEYQGLTFKKLTDSLDNLGPHCSLMIPEEYPFAKETGMFSVVGKEGVFFISNGLLRDGVRGDSGLTPDHEVYLLMHKEVFDRRMEHLNSLRHHDGFGPVLKLAGMDVRKVSDEVPYVGYLRTHPLTDEMYESHDWLFDSSLDQKKVMGVYRIMNSSDIFFIQYGEIAVHGEEENHPLLAALQEKFPVPKGYYDDVDEGPFGGAFASFDDYWRYRDSSLFR